MVNIENLVNNISDCDESVDIERASEMVEALEYASHRLNDWELRFVDSISKQLNEKEWLSRKQYNRLTNMMEDHVE